MAEGVQTIYFLKLDKKLFYMKINIFHLTTLKLLDFQKLNTRKKIGGVYQIARKLERRKINFRFEISA